MKPPRVRAPNARLMEARGTNPAERSPSMNNGCAGIPCTVPSRLIYAARRASGSPRGTRIRRSAPTYTPGGVIFFAPAQIQRHRDVTCRPDLDKGLCAIAHERTLTDRPITLVWHGNLRVERFQDSLLPLWRHAMPPAMQKD
ncbi:unnamed protein product, partial [Iphiclides podalirius]